MSLNLRRFVAAGFVCSIFVGAVGCGGHVSVGSDGRPAPSPDAPTSTPAPSFTADQMVAAAAQCAAAHGPSDRYNTIDELVALLSGSWIYCGKGAQKAMIPFHEATEWIGAELTADGHFYWLAADASSGVVRGRGIEGAAGYEITPPYDAQYNNVSFQITVWYADRSQMDTRATFERDPRRLALQGIDGYFVPLTR